MPYTQENSRISIATPAGADTLLLQEYSGAESIARIFHFDLELLAEKPVDAETIIGQKVSISTVLSDERSKRYVSGYINRFSYAGMSARFQRYHAELVPWLWFLTRTANCRIFQNQTVPEIITTVFNEIGFADYREALQGDFEPIEYCVQYRETDFNFVSRLMERYGIFYFFEHRKDGHTLVLANAPSVHRPNPGQPKARYECTGDAVQGEDVIRQWKHDFEFRPSKVALTDYNFETPNTNLIATESSNLRLSTNENYEIFDYPGDYSKKSQGEDVVKIRMEEEEVLYKIARGVSTCRAFTPGYRFDLVDHPQSGQDDSYVITEVQHLASAGNAYLGEGHGAQETYSNQFKCIPLVTKFRPLRLTPRPVVQGPQTAMVVGPAGEEIYTEKYGRVKVQFHWDREGKRDENSSCWMRVSQPWGGNSWGGMWIPRIGQEVIVEFLEGDPDRPIITGRVYNADQLPPYELPSHSTRSTMKSRSSKGGSAKNFNELRFEDKNGAEQLFLHAERDCDQRSKNDSREWVGKDRSLMIQGNQKEAVEGNKHAKVTGDQAEQVGGKMSLKVGGDCHQQVGSLYVVQSGQEIHLTSGMKVVIDAGMQLTIKAAGGFIDIGPAGVTIQGIMVNINSGGSAGSGSGCSPDNPEKPDVADDGTVGGKLGE